MKRLISDQVSLIVFPEGTRTPRGSQGRYKTGASRLAVATGVPIVVNELPYSLLTRAIEFDILPCCRALGVGVLGWAGCAVMLAGILLAEPAAAASSKVKTYPTSEERRAARPPDRVREDIAPYGSRPAPDSTGHWPQVRARRG